ncbi:MAG: hypothetical protein ACR2L3_00135 [Actinomycetota bacterium]
MGFLSKWREGSPDWASKSRTPLEQNHQLVGGWIQPGEVCLPPLDVLDWIEATNRLTAAPKDRREHHRLLLLTDRRLRIGWPDHQRWADITFDIVVKIDVLVIEQPFNDRDRLIHIQYDDPRGEKLVRFLPAARDVEAFRERLVKHVSKYKLAAFKARHGEFRISSAESAEYLKLLAIAGEIAPPPLIRDRKVEHPDLSPPVTAWPECPVCEGPLARVEAAAHCESCGRVWCDPMRSLALDEDGHLVGTKEVDLGEFSMSDISEDRHKRVRAYLVSAEFDWTTPDWR